MYLTSICKMTCRASLTRVHENVVTNILTYSHNVFALERVVTVYTLEGTYTPQEIHKTTLWTCIHDLGAGEFTRSNSQFVVKYIYTPSPCFHVTYGYGFVVVTSEGYLRLGSRACSATWRGPCARPWRSSSGPGPGPPGCRRHQTAGPRGCPRTGRLPSRRLSETQENVVVKFVMSPSTRR